jgi:hypothetical protein
MGRASDHMRDAAVFAIVISAWLLVQHAMYLLNPEPPCWDDDECTDLDQLRHER